MWKLLAQDSLDKQAILARAEKKEFVIKKVYNVSLNVLDETAMGRTP